VTPLIHLIKKDQPFFGGIEAKNAFQSLKASFTIGPLLIHLDPSKPFVLKTNASNYALSVVLSQPKKKSSSSNWFPFL
jgi:hypothetical protein